MACYNSVKIGFCFSEDVLLELWSLVERLLSGLLQPAIPVYFSVSRYFMPLDQKLSRRSFDSWSATSQVAGKLAAESVHRFPYLFARVEVLLGELASHRQERERNC